MVKDTDTSWIEADAWNDDDVGDNGEGIIPMSSLASIESYLLQLKGKAGDNDVSASTGDPSRAKVLAAQALGSLDTFLPKSLKADTLRAATDLGVWDALSAAVYSGFDVSEVEDACVIAMAQLLVPPPPENFPSRYAPSPFDPCTSNFLQDQYETLLPLFSLTDPYCSTLPFAGMGSKPSWLPGLAPLPLPASS